MKVEKLTLKNFRNIQESTLTPDPHLNFLVGKNGQGKTSFLEALSYLATLRSFRGAKNDEVIRWGQPRATVECVISDSGAIPGTGPSDPTLHWKSDLSLEFARPAGQPIQLGGKNRATKTAFINQKPYRSSTSYLSQRFGQFEFGFHAVVFNPSDHDLVRGEPALRRAYIDRLLAAEHLEYLTLHQKYQRVLDQRNALLKNEDRPSRTLLAGFTEPLAHYGAALTYQRLLWVERVRERLNDLVHQIAPNQPSLAAIYLSNWVPKITNLSSSNNDLDSVHFAGQDTLPSLELLEQAFWNQLSLLEEAELRSRSSLVGPHRDDWAFLLGGQVLKGHGSQGEVRSALLALKLCEIELFRKQTGHRPLLLLDDFSSELDRDRRAFLLRFLTETDLQVFVTTTEDSVFAGKRYWVFEGQVAENPIERASTLSEARNPEA